MEEKRCKKCKLIKTKEEYHRNGKYIRSYCKLCASEYHKQRSIANPLRRREEQLKSLYGIDLKEFDRLSASQGDTCAICRVPSSLHVDHAHNTGNVRGLLCQNCNRGLGMFKDNIEYLANAIKYLSIR